MLAACASNEELLKPTPLEPIESRVKFKKLWQTSVGDDFSDHRLLLEVAVNQDHVVAVDPNGRLTSWHPMTGRRQWRLKLNRPVVAGVAIDNEQVYVGFDSGDLAAYSLQSNEKQAVWQVFLGGEMAVPPDTARDYLATQTINGQIQVINRKSGKVIWLYDAVSPSLTLRGTSQPTIDRQQVIAGFSNGKLAAFDLKTGLVNWERVLGNAQGYSDLDRLMDVDSVFWVGDGLVAAGSYQGRVGLMELSQGRPLWFRNISSYTAITKGFDGFFVTDEQGVLWSLAIDSGRTHWQQSQLMARRLTGCAIIGRYCVAGDFDGYLHVFDQTSGELVGRTRFGRQPIRTLPKVFNNTLYVISTNGQLAAFELKEKQ